MCTTNVISVYSISIQIPRDVEFMCYLCTYYQIQKEKEREREERNTHREKNEDI